MGLKGVSIFVILILLKPFYEKLFPYADLLIIAAALFLCFWYLEAYFNYIREGIYTQIEGNKNSLEKFEGHAIKKFSEIESAFAETYSEQEIERCVHLFFKRFFTNQFKRSCSPEGAAVLPISLSPRSSWCMPSDIQPYFLTSFFN